MTPRSQSARSAGGTGGPHSPRMAVAVLIDVNPKDGRPGRPTTAGIPRCLCGRRYVAADASDRFGHGPLRAPYAAIALTPNLLNDERRPGAMRRVVWQSVCHTHHIVRLQNWTSRRPERPGNATCRRARDACTRRAGWCLPRDPAFVECVRRAARH